jgi:hypothetical protein
MQPDLVLDEIEDHITNVERSLLDIAVMVASDALKVAG